MNKLKVAFDVDETLITGRIGGCDVPRWEVIQFFKSLESFGCEMYIWSGSGTDWASRWAEKLGLDAKIVAKGSFTPDITVDDEDVKLGTVNIRVPIDKKALE